MEINNLNINTGASKNKQVDSGGSSKATESKNTNAESVADTVFISNESQAIKDLETSIKEEPDFDQAKVDQIKAAIADGNFAIDDEALADNIMQFEDILG